MADEPQSTASPEASLKRIHGLREVVLAKETAWDEAKAVAKDRKDGYEQAVADLLAAIDEETQTMPLYDGAESPPAEPSTSVTFTTKELDKVASGLRVLRESVNGAGTPLVGILEAAGISEAVTATLRSHGLTTVEEWDAFWSRVPPPGPAELGLGVKTARKVEKALDDWRLEQPGPVPEINDTDATVESEASE